MEQMAAAPSLAPTSWPTDSKSYELVERIGRGAFSTVWRAQLFGSDGASTTAAAVKIIDLENVMSSFEDILQEVQTMRLSKDANILRFYCSFVQANQLWMVTQLMDMGSCLRVMNIAKAIGLGEGMNEEWLAYILRESLQGLAYLHSNGQIHRDMKAGNILLDSRGGVRLADFGVSGWTFAGGQRQEKVTTFVGTPCYMAPEVMEQAGGYDNRADIWSLGITALELAKGKAPYAHLSPMRVLVVTIEEDPPSLKSYTPPNECQRTGAPFSSAFDEFYKKCLQKNPKLRPPASELLKHKFLQQRSPEALVNQLLVQIGMVGQAEQEERASVAKLAGEGTLLLEKFDDDVDSDSSLADSIRGGLLLGCGGSDVGGDSVKLGGEASGGAESSGSYVSGTTWVFDSDEVGSSGELRRSHGGSPRGGSSVRFSSLGRKPVGSPTASSFANSKIVSPSLDDFLADFEREASTLPSLPAATNKRDAPPPSVPVSFPVPVPVPVPTPTVRTTKAEDDSADDFLREISSDFGTQERI